MPFEPELPPDATDEQSPLPVPAVAVTAIAAAPPSLEKPRGDWPVAKSIGGPAPAPGSAAAQPGDLRSTGASPGDVEAAVEAMLKADVRPQAPGAREARAERLAVGVFYFKRGFAPLWTNENGLTPRAKAAIGRIGRAGDDGLDLSAFALPTADSKIGTPTQRAEAEILLSQAVIAYAVQASGGRVEPSSISPQITAKPDVADPFKALATRSPPPAILTPRSKISIRRKRAIAICATSSPNCAPSGRRSRQDPVGPDAQDRHERSARAAHSRALRPRCARRGTDVGRARL